MRIKDIKFDPPNHPFAVDVIKDHQTSKGDQLVCIKCKKKYKRGVWDFYSLCNNCFRLFNQQKMEGRFRVRKKYFEIAKEWVKEGK